MSGEGSTAAGGAARSFAVAAADPRWEPAPRGWYLALVAGSLPAFVLGMLASALANRLVFVAWAVVVGLGHALLLRGAWQRGWSVAGRLALALAWWAAGCAVLAALVARHQEILDLGYRAVLWPVYAPVLARPATARVVAVVLAALAAGAAGRALVAHRRAAAAMQRSETQPASATQPGSATP